MPSSNNNNTYRKTSFLAGNNSSFIEKFYSDYLLDPKKLPKDWKLFFDGLKENEEIIIKDLQGPSWSLRKKDNLKIKTIKKDIKENTISKKNSEKEKEHSVKAIALIRAYRIRGHLIANLDPLEMMERKYLEDLHPSDHGFKKEDYNKKIYVGAYMEKGYTTVNDILAFFRKIYCSNIGVEYMHISDPTEKIWFRERMEKRQF